MDAIEFMANIFHPFKWVLWAAASQLFHYRQNFYHWSLWVPVVTLWSLAFTLLLHEFLEAQWTFIIVMINLFIVMTTHLWGFYLHWIGVSKRVGGQNIHNHMVGPPVILPLIVFTVSTLDFLRLLQGD